jgi:uncharacterized protein
MIRRLATFTIALACALSAGAQGYTVETVPNVQLTDSRRFVTNPDGILSPATEGEIDRLCGDLRQRGLAEVVVLVLERVEDNSLDGFAHNVLNRWGVGQRGKDNGLAISVVRSQRDIQFETGYGLEGVLPDALCKRIQTVYMTEPLRAGDFDTGVMAGVKAVYNVLTDNEAELGALRAAGDTPTGGLGTLGVMGILFVVVMAAGIISAAVRAKRGGGRRGGRGGWDDPDDPASTGGFGGPSAGSILGGILGGLIGGGFGGGGFGGGSFGGGFGGGRSGGGGARTGF